MKLDEEQRYALPDGPVLEVDEHGRRVVLEAGDRISMILDGLNQMLHSFGATSPIEPDPDGTVTLDSAGEYRYRLVTHDRWRRTVGIYERVAGRIVKVFEFEVWLSTSDALKAGVLDLDSRQIPHRRRQRQRRVQGRRRRGMA